MNNAYLLIGGNLGDRSFLLQTAEELIEKHCGTILKSSGLYETEAWGDTEQPAFLNKALWLQTPLAPIELLEKVLEIELMLGRERVNLWGPRTMDIDLLFFENIVMESEQLVLPHPRICIRRFVLEPLTEICGNMVHPLEQKTIVELLAICSDVSKVVRLDGVFNNRQ